jgi:hypothetical protein
LLVALQIGLRTFLAAIVFLINTLLVSSFWPFKKTVIGRRRVTRAGEPTRAISSCAVC